MIKIGIGKNIKKYRKNLGLTQGELANRLNVSNKTISSWEIDRTEPTMQYVTMLCEIFGCTKNELTGFTQRFDVENAHLVAQVRNDTKLTEALTIYFGLSDVKKQKVIEFINLLAD
jgi:transcriptional regulator with XRE-family HTH domain